MNRNGLTICELLLSATGALGAVACSTSAGSDASMDEAIESSQAAMRRAPHPNALRSPREVRLPLHR